MSTLLVQAPAAIASEKAGSRIPTLDGWRGVAILLVLADHMQRGLRSNVLEAGQHGVVIFFVISGFLITSKLRDELLETGRLRLARFYVRRFFRLMPAAWVYLIIAWLLTGSPKARLEFDLPSCIFFYRNFTYPVRGSFLTGHFWSLSIEEQYYLFWPITLLLLGFRRSRWFALAAAVTVAILRFHHWPELMNLEVGPVFETQYRADALFIGCAAALSLPLLTRYIRQWMIGPLLLLLTICIFRFTSLIPLRESILIAVLLVATSTFNKSWAGKLLECKPITFIGGISYSLYLWQEPLLASRIPDLTSAAFRLAIVFIVGTLCHYCLEKPAIKFGRRCFP